MSLFWELFQELQINKRKQHANTLEERIGALEEELLFTQNVLARTLEQLEQLTGTDFGVDEPEN